MPPISLIQRRDSLVADMRRITSAAEAEKRDLTASENSSYEDLDGELDRLREQLADIERKEARAEYAEAVRGPHRGALSGSSDRQARNAEDRSLREFGEAVFGSGGQRAGDFEYSGQYIEAVERRAALSDFANGADLVPVTFADFVAVYQRTLNPTYGLARVIRSTSGENLTIPRLTADSTSYKPGEGTAITESEPTFSSVTLTLTSYKGLAYASQEMVQDNGIQLPEMIAQSAGRTIGLSAGTDFTTGTTGFITLGTNGGTAAGTPFFDADDLISLYYSAPAPYRLSSSAAWQMSNAAIQKVRKFKSTTGEYLWEDSLQAGQPPMLLGVPVYENPAMASVGSATKPVAFGDWSSYVIKEVVPMRVQASQDFLFNLDQVAYKTVWRAGGNLPDVAGIRYLVSGNA
jgi:HK97 family phage major capsid protein